MEKKESESRIRKVIEKGELIVSRVYYGDYQKTGDGEMTAELKQEFTTTAYYPEKSVESDLQANIYKPKDFGYSEKPYVNKSTRVAWIDVPEGSTVESVMKDLEAFPEAMIYRIMSNHPVLTNNQKFAVNNPDYEATMESYAHRQVIRESTKDKDEKGPLALFNGKLQYKSNFFTDVEKEDIDLRNEDPKDMFITSELQSEMDPTFVVEDQKL